MQDDLKAWGQQLDKDMDQARSLVMKTMQHWQRDTDFADVRGPEALGRLPEVERQDWQKLWDEVESLRQRATERPGSTFPERPWEQV